MSDPLSVAASVAGLLTAAQMTSAAISKLVSTKKSGSSEINDIKTTVDTLRPVVQQVQLLLLNQAKIHPERAAMILFEEIALTLTELVRVFSDLKKCIEGLDADQKLGWLDSVRWLSKADELKGYLQRLEKGKSSLILMISIVTTKSTFAAETAVGELRTMWVQSNQEMSERMARMEKMMARSVLVGGNDSGSIFSKDIVSDATVVASTNPTIHPALGFSFDDDLQTSWVYKRAKAHATRPFSIASSTQLTQSWSILSALSLSQISNIAVQALPIFESDLHNSNLYSFGDAEMDGLLASSPSNMQKHKRSTSEGWRSQIRSRLTQSGPKLTLTTQAGSNVETITLPRGLRLLGRSPTVSSRKPLRKADISEPILLSSSAYEGVLTQTSSKAQPLELVVTAPAADVTLEGNNEQVPQIHIASDAGSVTPADTTDTDNDSYVETGSNVAKDAPKLEVDIGEKWTPPNLDMLEFQMDDLKSRTFEDRRNHHKTRWQPPLDPFYPNPSSSAMPMDDEVDGDIDTGIPEYNVLYIAASLFQFNIRNHMEAGWPYLSYQAGEIFDVVAEKGELWLAKSQDDPSNQVGWIWSKHFVPLARDDVEDGKKQIVPSKSKSRIPRKIKSRDSRASSDSGFDFGFR
ncbi:hypothetical protein ONS95_005404 [Cadophora gregata]|uniref:uncharacterized protein n=1 Tax=Cadophora gregata TaxID=51156 RepID=UPI0026DDC4AB|nr:uncharacterized protein ONS95_005404 [Cadophora gregata]KAK0103378.1 hypothetical protein ONS95_005404 [Cadophora gregata]KAK0107569.1 hypothetical protein ONS96_003375 [Cadophora gregata f. sp. sojae]